MQVAGVDLIIIDDGQTPDARRDESENHGRSEPSRTDDGHVGAREATLPEFSEPGKTGVPSRSCPLAIAQSVNRRDQRQKGHGQQASPPPSAQAHRRQ